MKYLIVVPDGAADYPIDEMGGKTPLETANMKNINEMAKKGIVGMVQNVPEGIAPGSDAANLSVMGYDPKIYLTGRSPLEAASIGIEMEATDVAFRVNLISLADSKTGKAADEKTDTDYRELVILDHSSGDITTAEADELVKAMERELGSEGIKLYTGVSYRHCMIMKQGSDVYDLTPPHDVLGQSVGGNLPKDGGFEGAREFSAAKLAELMEKSYEILRKHPVNMKRISEGKNPANSAWIWGQGKKPALSSFKEKYGISGSAISAVDLIKGIAICAGLDAPNISGATGTLHTNYEGKADAAVKAFQEGQEFVYIHVEGPDECGHQGDRPGKIKSLELIDEKIVGPVVEMLRKSGEDFKVLIVPDHRTPLSIRTHSAEPVPFVLYDSRKDKGNESKDMQSFCEISGEKGECFVSGVELADYFFKGNRHEGKN